MIRQHKLNYNWADFDFIPHKAIKQYIIGFKNVKLCWSNQILPLGTTKSVKSSKKFYILFSSFFFFPPFPNPLILFHLHQGGENSQLFRRLIITAPALLLDKSYHHCSCPHAWLALPSLFLPICLISLTTSGTFDVDWSFTDWSPINKLHQQTGQTDHLRNLVGDVWVRHVKGNSRMIQVLRKKCTCYESWNGLVIFP